eukprot:SAG22_NODE_427_length_10603_cov_19.158225_7_plen_315_part_00
MANVLNTHHRSINAKVHVQVAPLVRGAWGRGADELSGTVWWLLALRPAHGPACRAWLCATFAIESSGRKMMSLNSEHCHDGLYSFHRRCTRTHFVAPGCNPMASTGARRRREAESGSPDPAGQRAVRGAHIAADRGAAPAIMPPRQKPTQAERRKRSKQAQERATQAAAHAAAVQAAQAGGELPDGLPPGEYELRGGQWDGYNGTYLDNSGNSDEFDQQHHDHGNGYDNYDYYEEVPLRNLLLPLLSQRWARTEISEHHGGPASRPAPLPPPRPRAAHSQLGCRCILTACSLPPPGRMTTGTTMALRRRKWTPR